MSPLVAMLVAVTLGAAAVDCRPQWYGSSYYDQDYDPYPRYSYSYGVDSPLTGDIKQQDESRDGDVVRGSYSLVDADGSHRRVDYTADPVAGFSAVVSRNGVPVDARGHGYAFNRRGGYYGNYGNYGNYGYPNNFYGGYQRYGYNRYPFYAY